MAMFTGQAVYSVLQMPQGDSYGLLLDPVLRTYKIAQAIACFECRLQVINAKFYP